MSKPLKLASKSDSASSIHTDSDEDVKVPEQTNFMQKNKHFNNNYSSVKKVDTMFKDPNLMKYYNQFTDQLESPEEFQIGQAVDVKRVGNKYGFDRYQMMKFYILFKTLCKLTIMADQNQEVFGVNFHVFKEGITELSLENKELVRKIFKKANVSCTGFLNWEEFLEAMRTIFTDSLEVKIEMFFDIIDR